MHKKIVVKSKYKLANFINAVCPIVLHIPGLKMAKINYRKVECRIGRQKKIPYHGGTRLLYSGLKHSLITNNEVVKGLFACIKVVQYSKQTEWKLIVLTQNVIYFYCLFFINLFCYCPAVEDERPCWLDSDSEDEDDSYSNGWDDFGSEENSCDRTIDYICRRCGITFQSSSAGEYYYCSDCKPLADNATALQVTRNVSILLHL